MRDWFMMISVAVVSLALVGFLHTRFRRLADGRRLSLFLSWLYVTILFLAFSYLFVPQVFVFWPVCMLGAAPALAYLVSPKPAPTVEFSLSDVGTTKEEDFLY